MGILERSCQILQGLFPLLKQLQFLWDFSFLFSILFGSSLILKHQTALQDKECHSKLSAYQTFTDVTENTEKSCNIFQDLTMRIQHFLGPIFLCSHNQAKVLDFSEF